MTCRSRNRYYMDYYRDYATAAQKTMTWPLHVTVAAVVGKGDSFLLVEEQIGGKPLYNQPAGHLEENESLVEAVVRETLEETAHHFTPRHVVGVYQWQQPGVRDTYIRVAFAGDAQIMDDPPALDDGVLGAHWMDVEQIRALPAARFRSPMVRRCIEDCVAGRRLPLSAVVYLNERDKSQRR